MEEDQEKGRAGARAGDGGEEEVELGGPGGRNG